MPQRRSTPPPGEVSLFQLPMDSAGVRATIALAPDGAIACRNRDAERGKGYRAAEATVVVTTMAGVLHAHAPRRR